MTEALTVEIDQKRLAKIMSMPLKSGGHDGIKQGACIMEAVAYIRRQPWSDHPECVCPVIGSFLRSWNDGLPDDERDALLKPLILKVLNTKGSPALETRRSLMAADWLVRTHTVAWLRLANLNDQADLLANLPEITATAQIPSIRGPIEAVRKDAAAAWAAAWDAAWDAARDAARAAAWAAAWDAAWDALKDTKAQLQQSAVALVERMCALTDTQLSAVGPADGAVGNGSSAQEPEKGT